MSKFDHNRKIGILGGGQLGKMLLHKAGEWDLNTYVLDKSKSFPAFDYCKKFIEGDFTNYDDVYNFGKQVDLLTVEIEKVNINALIDLEKEGLEIHPRPSALQIIQDKGLQKNFYQKNKLATSSYFLVKNKIEIEELIGSKIKFPFVQKARKDGYDGKGVALIKSKKDLHKIMDTPSVIEPLIDIDKELAVVVARNTKGEISAFPIVDMVFNTENNLVEFVGCPVTLPSETRKKLYQIAHKLIQDFDICGLLAVEFFFTKQNEILINEVAPRPHNSGHLTMNANLTCQFEQHLRGIMGLPLGSTLMVQPGVMVNILGAKDKKGNVKYIGVDTIMEEPGVYLHLYGKKITKPSRKMGHINILAQTREAAVKLSKKVKATVSTDII